MGATLVDIPDPPRLERSSYGRRSVTRSLLGLVLRLFLFATILTAVWGGWYLSKKGFGRQWRHKIVEELQKRGVEASVRRLTLDPFRGLVAQDVRIFDSKDRENTIALISEVSLDINYAALLHRQPFLNAVDVRNADLTFPILAGDPNAPKAQLKNFRAHVYFPPDQIYVSQAEGLFCGIRVSVSGQVIKPGAFKPDPETSEEESRRRMQLLQQVVTELSRLNFIGGPPQLQLKFAGDLSQPELARVEATLRSGAVRRGGYEIGGLFAAAEWSEQTLNLRQCEWNDSAGRFAGRASWRRESNEAEFEARSSIDLKRFLEALGFGRMLADATFTSPPVVELSGAAKTGTEGLQLNAIGRIAVDNFSFKKVALSNASADFSWDGKRAMLRGLRVRHESGELIADLFDAPNDFRLNLESNLNPTAFRLLAPEGLQKFLGEWEWQRSPAVRLEIRGPERAPGTWKGTGKIALERTRFRGVWMNSAIASVRFGDGAVSIDDLKLTRDEGVGTGSFTYDLAKREVRIANAKTTLRPAEAIYWIVPKYAKDVAPYKFRQAPSLAVQGLVDLRGGRNTHLEIRVDAPQGMDYVFLGKTLPIDRIAGQLLFTDDRLRLSDVRGGLFEGVVVGTADISLEKANPRYSAELSVNGIDFPRLTDLYFNYETARGELSGNYAFTGLGDEARTMRGTGKIKVANGNIFAIPIFGPLSGLIGAILPGTGYSVAHQADANFTINDGLIHTDNLKISGKLFGMVGHGDIHFLDDKLDLDIRISGSGPGALLTPMYKLFEYKGEGSLAKPNWHAKRF